MRSTGKRAAFAAALLALSVVFFPAPVMSAPDTADTTPAEAKGTSTPAAPDLADVIPLASALPGRVAVLESRMEGGPDVDEVRSRYDEIFLEVEETAGRLKLLKKGEGYKYNKLIRLSESTKHAGELLEEASSPVNQMVRRLGDWREEWLKEKTRWSEWQSSLQRDEALDRLTSTFTKARGTIDGALELLRSRLDVLLAVQEKAGGIRGKIDSLDADLNSMITVEKRNTLIDKTPPMISAEYFAQVGSRELGYALKKGMGEVAWPERDFFSRWGWILFAQGVLIFLVSFALYRNRKALRESERWTFLSVRPLSAGLFLGFIATVFLYEYHDAPAGWKMINATVGYLSVARLAGVIVAESWQRKFVYGLLIILVATRVLEVSGIPLPLFRLYTVLAALASLIFGLRLAGESERSKAPRLYPWVLRAASLFFAAVILSQLFGKTALASYLFVSAIRSTAAVLGFALSLYMIQGILAWLFNSSIIRKGGRQGDDDTDVIVRRVMHFLGILASTLLLLPALLVIWGVYDSLEGATGGLLALGVNLGEQRITVGLLLVAAGILYGSFLASWVIQKMLMEEMFVRRRVERGVRVSIGKLIHYVLVVTGFLLALSALGFEISKLTIMLSALGVGIGFGLQDVVRNFVSGLILLFEQPVRVGDIIEVDGTWAEITKIGIRATIVRTFDQSDLIIPNADLVGNKVTNWTLGNRQARLIVPVGIAYGSDVPLAMETLKSCARENGRVVASPEPQVLFLGFGESSLDFELRLRIQDIDYRLQTRSELHQEIDRRFREENIEISFPQRDLHLRSVDEPVMRRYPERSEEMPAEK